MKHWLHRITSNRDFLNMGDTRMVYCNLSEDCSKNRIGYKEFISSLEWEVIENKKQSFKQIDIDKKKIILKKLISALDNTHLWLYENFTPKELDELTLLQLKCSLAETLEGMKPYFDKYYELAIQNFSEQIQEAMDAIHADYMQDYSAQKAVNDAIDDELDRIAFGEY